MLMELFLLGKFTDGEVIFMMVTQGFHKFNPGDVLLNLKKTLNGLSKQGWPSGKNCQRQYEVWALREAHQIGVFISNGRKMDWQLWRHGLMVT